MEIDRRVNEGVVDVLLRTGCKVTTTTATLSTTATDYTLSTSILRVKDVYVTSGGTNYLLEHVSLPEIRQLQALNTTTQSPAQVYAVAGSNMITVYPGPSAADTLNITYVPYPATLAASGTSPDEVPLEFQPAIELYALWRLADMDDDQSSAQGQRYHDLYLENLRTISRYVAKKGGPLPRAVVNRRGRILARPPHDNSRYYG